MTDDPFAALGLGPDADADAVRDARRRLAKHHHPDQGGDAARMQAINEAADAALHDLRTGDPAPPADEASPPTSSPSSPSGPSGSSGASGSPGTQGPRDQVGDDFDGRRVQRDAPSFTVEALPVETYEALLIAAAWLGESIDDDPPYRLDAYLGEPFDCWCRLDVVPDAGSSTVSLTVGGIDGRPAPDVVAVRDAWVEVLNSLSALPPS